MRRLKAESRRFKRQYTRGALVEDVHFSPCIDDSESEKRFNNLRFVEVEVTTIALTGKKDTIAATKSTVPDGTNDRLRQIIDRNILYHIIIEVDSKSEFFEKESTIDDSLHRNVMIYAERKCFISKKVEGFRYRNYAIGKMTIIPTFPKSFGSWCG